MNPRSAVSKWPMFGKTVATSLAGSPYHGASVAAYWSTEVVGMNRPWFPESSGPPRASVGQSP